MFLYELMIDEGPHDPHIFKAVFMAGSPGAGKTTIANKLFSGSGLKFVDLDRFEALYRARGHKVEYHSDTSYDHFWKLSQKQKKNYVDGRLGMIIDGTAKDLDRIITQKHILEKMGYSTAMIFVNTDLQTAIQRVDHRFKTQGRPVARDRVTKSWNMSQQNMGKLQEHFGASFFIVDNSKPNIDVGHIAKKVDHFLRTPPSDYRAKEWLQQQQATR